MDGDGVLGTAKVRLWNRQMRLASRLLVISRGIVRRTRDMAPCDVSREGERNS
jgi:hypothetical protein